MREERKAVKGYENLYEITRSGSIYSLKRKRTLKRRGDEYGFHVVKLSNNGEANNHNVFELWKQHFPALNESEFKGAKTVKYKLKIWEYVQKWSEEEKKQERAQSMCRLIVR